MGNSLNWRQCPSEEAVHHAYECLDNNLPIRNGVPLYSGYNPEWQQQWNHVPDSSHGIQPWQRKRPYPQHDYPEPYYHAPKRIRHDFDYPDYSGHPNTQIAYPYFSGHPTSQIDCSGYRGLPTSQIDYPDYRGYPSSQIDHYREFPSSQIDYPDYTANPTSQVDFPHYRQCSASQMGYQRTRRPWNPYSPQHSGTPWQAPACVPKLEDVVGGPWQIAPPEPEALDFTGTLYPPQKAIKFSKQDLDNLHNLAVKFVSNSRNNTFKLCKAFYRNKSKSYYDDIMNKYGGVMEPYMKDFNGDPASWINGRIKGLFFAASMNSRGNVPSFSPFGDWRLSVPPNWMMVPEEMNLYFADFYCLVDRWPHYVTLVLTAKSSETDKFCMQKLKKMNMWKNNFLKVDPSGHVHVTSNVLIEVFYTECVPVADWLESPYCTLQKAVGPPVSPCKNGLPKDLTCEKCNFLPEKKQNQSNEGGSQKSKKLKEEQKQETVKHVLQVKKQNNVIIDVLENQVSKGKQNVEGEKKGKVSGEEKETISSKEESIKKEEKENFDRLE